MLDDPIVDAVRAKLLARSRAGIAKYGTALDRVDLTRLDWLRHAQEEALDLANYLEVLIRLEGRSSGDRQRDRLPDNIRDALAQYDPRNRD